MLSADSVTIPWWWSMRGFKSSGIACFEAKAAKILQSQIKKVIIEEPFKVHFIN